MTVNSRLDMVEKDRRKEYMGMLEPLNAEVHGFSDYGVTVAMMPEFPGSRMMLVSISIAEPRETKFKRKVGEYHALRRLFDDTEYIKLPSVFNQHFIWRESWVRRYAQVCAFGG